MSLFIITAKFTRSVAVSKAGCHTETVNQIPSQSRGAVVVEGSVSREFCQCFVLWSNGSQYRVNKAT